MAQIKTARADIRAKYKRYFEISLIITLLILIAAFKFVPKENKAKEIHSSIDPLIRVENTPNTEHEVSRPNAPKPPVPIVSDTDEIIDIPFEENDIFNPEINDLPKPSASHNRIIEEENVIFEAVENPPEIIGGLKSLQEKLYYTEIAKRAGIEGRVIVSAIIDKNGNVANAEIYVSLSDDLDQIALKAVKELKFIPGMQRGKPVIVRMSIPIVFKLT